MLPIINFEKCPGGNIQTLPGTVSAFKEAFKFPISLEQEKINIAYCFTDNYPEVAVGTVAGCAIGLHPEYPVWLGGRRAEQDKQCESETDLTQLQF